MKTFINGTRFKALQWRLMVICGGIFLMCTPVFAQTAATGGGKIDKSKLTIHGNLRDAQPQHFDNKRSSVVSYNKANGSRKVTRLNKPASHVRTQQGTAAKVNKKIGTKSIKVRKRIKHGGKELTHRNKPKSRHRH